MHSVDVATTWVIFESGAIVFDGIIIVGVYDIRLSRLKYIVQIIALSLSLLQFFQAHLNTFVHFFLSC